MPTAKAKLEANLKAAGAAPRCQHVRYNNSRCGAPARAGSPFCIFHAPNYEGMPATVIPEDAATIQIELATVLRQLDDQDSDTRRAGLKLYALQVASMNLRRLASELRPEESDALPERPEDLAFHICMRLGLPEGRGFDLYGRCLEFATALRAEVDAMKKKLAREEISG